MTLRHLRIFVAVCEWGSATAAAKKLFTTQPAVSLAIAELEEHYGHPLFDRLRGRLHITGAGQEFLQYAAHIVSLFDDMERQARNWDVIGLLRVGSSVTIGNCLLPGLLARFREQYPQMQVRTAVNNSGQVEGQVLRSEIDLGLVEGRVRSEYLVVKPFLDDELVFVCPAGHRWSAGEIPVWELEKEPLALREEGSAVRESLEAALRVHGMAVTPVWQSISTQAILQAVRSGIGVSVLPRRLAAGMLGRGEIETFRVKGIALTRQFSLIYHRNKYLGEAAQVFMGLCFALAESENC